LSAIKTKVLSKEEFQRRIVQDPEREVHDDLATLLAFSGRFDEYSDEEVELSDEE